MYELFIDRPTEFICEIAVKNANLKNAFARMIIKSDNVTLLCEGKIENGKCIIPIQRLKGLLDENVRGKMILEVVVEDTYFSPWHDEFLTEEHTSVKVKVNEAKVSNKPVVEVKVPAKTKKNNINVYVPLHEISRICQKFGINRSNLTRKKHDFQQLLKEYFRSNPEFKGHKLIIISGLKYFIK